MNIPKLKIKQADEGYLHIEAEDGTDFLTFVDLANSPELREQMAKEIAYRCNCFNELLEACKNLLIHYESKIEVSWGLLWNNQLEHPLIKAKQAIAKAEGGKL